MLRWATRRLIWFPNIDIQCHSKIYFWSSGVECPPFDVLRIYRNGIQKRLYYDGVFAATAIDDCLFTNIAIWKGFMPLHLYKHGKQFLIILSSKWDFKNVIVVVFVVAMFKIDIQKNCTYYMLKKLKLDPTLKKKQHISSYRVSHKSGIARMKCILIFRSIVY